MMGTQTVEVWDARAVVFDACEYLRKADGEQNAVILCETISPDTADAELRTLAEEFDQEAVANQAGVKGDFYECLVEIRNKLDLAYEED